MKRTNKLINTNPSIEDHVLKSNRHFPNSIFPLLVYRSACLLGKQKNKSVAALQELFSKHNWRNTWSNGIYGFHHYHSNCHECLGIAMGKAWVIFGGPGGRRVVLEKGDVVIIPAGLAHKCTKTTADFVCVGAYPRGKQYDVKLGTKDELEQASLVIAKLPTPALDPVFGKEGFLKIYWGKRGKGEKGKRGRGEGEGRR